MGIRQLASELQLSIGTVSRALNDRPDVNPETRARVKAAAARAGYVPNQSGRSLRSGRTGIVAAVIPTRGSRRAPTSGLFTVLEGARRTLRRHALDLIVLFRGPDEDPLENLQRIVQRRIADARDHQRDHGARPAARLPAGRRRRLRRLRPQRRARRLSVRRLRLRGDGARGRAPLRRATATGASALATGERRCNYEDDPARRRSRAEAVRLGLGATPSGCCRCEAAGSTEAGPRGASPRPDGADGDPRHAREPRRRRSTATSPSSGCGSARDVSVDLHLPDASTPARWSRRSRTSTPTSTRSASRWPSSCIALRARRAATGAAPPAPTLVPLRFVAARQPRRAPERRVRA